MFSKKVLVSGCFDCLHSGHVAFLESAARYGDLYVCIGNDANIFALKNRPVAQTQEERLYMVKSLKCVHEAMISKGMGMIDFVEELETIRPDYFVVNEDGHQAAKQALCEKWNIEYVILERVPADQMPTRSTTAIRSQDLIPYRIDLAGGWLDQPFVSKLHPGSVITISVDVTFEVNARSGMASSTHDKAREIWGHQLPNQEVEKIAKILFACDNPPGKENISGSQDAIGIVFPGVNRLFYNGTYWPVQIESDLEESTLMWLESVIQLIPLTPRAKDFEVLSQQHITVESAQRLAIAAEQVWNAIQRKDIKALGESMTKSLEAQVEMFPLMWNEEGQHALNEVVTSVSGYKISGAGGGGYLVVVSDQTISNAHRVAIRRKEKI